HRAHGVVVGVEQMAEGFVPEPVAWREGVQDELFEEPGRVREMPFRRARVGHRLHDVVLDRERLAERARPGPDVRIAFAHAGRKDGVGAPRSMLDLGHSVRVLRAVRTGSPCPPRAYGMT